MAYRCFGARCVDYPLYADTGRPQTAEAFARAYLRSAPDHPQLRPYDPWVIRAWSHGAYQSRRFALAARLRLKALAMFEAAGNADEITRTRLNLVWAFARAGRPANARVYLPEQANVPMHMAHLWQGALAAILVAEKRWPEALKTGQEALRGARAAHDYADAAEVALIMTLALRATGRHQAPALIERAAQFAALQERELYTLMVLNARAEGGETPYAAATRGSADLRDRGSYTTGVA